MAGYPFLASTDSIISPIEEIGNYFIMDSEQLVVNPFQEMQTEALTEAQKKASLTEKLTSVKNTVCDNHFCLQRAHLQRQKDSTLKQLQDQSSKLRYEVKLLDLDRQKHKIEVKKRLLPERDYSYDETKISNTEKRLGANIASFYLERKLKYPMRLKVGNDISVTPTVQKARQALKQHDVSKSADYTHSERAETAKTASSAAGTNPASPVRPALLERRNSRSAPLVTRSFSARATRSEETRLPAIGDGQETRSKPPQVKFMFEDSMKILTADDPMKMFKTRDESSPAQSRPYTYHAGMDHNRERFLSRDYASQDLSDDDDFSLPDHVDLRALLFHKDGGGQEEVQSSTKSLTQSNQVPTPILRRSQTFTPRITQELIQQESHQVQSKVHRFLEELNDDTPRHNPDSDTELETDIVSTAPQQSSTTQPPPFTDQEPNDENLDEHSFKYRRGAQSPSPPKDAWKYIKGDTNRGLKGTYRAEDLVLQTLTGVPLTRSLTAGIPLHAAGRALRHTATFKMRKVVEQLVNDRTKYQQHEVEEIKRKMDQGMDMHDAAASLIPAPTPTPAPPSRKQSRTDTTGSSMSGGNQSRPEPTMRPISQGVQG